MPIYEYSCGSCHHEFEMLQPMNAEPPAECPQCGQGPVRKLISATSFVLKGSGWYRDHYGLKSGGTSSSSGSGTTPSPARKASGTEGSGSTGSTAGSSSSSTSSSSTGEAKAAAK